MKQSSPGLVTQSERPTFCGAVQDLADAREKLRVARSEINLNSKTFFVEIEQTGDRCVGSLSPTAITHPADVDMYDMMLSGAE